MRASVRASVLCHYYCIISQIIRFLNTARQRTPTHIYECIHTHLYIEMHVGMRVTAEKLATGKVIHLFWPFHIS